MIVDAGSVPTTNSSRIASATGWGWTVTQWPCLVRGNTLKMLPGMTFSDEPGIYIRGEFGVRVEDDMLITENGAELLTPQSCIAGAARSRQPEGNGGAEASGNGA